MHCLPLGWIGGDKRLSSRAMAGCCGGGSVTAVGDMGGWRYKTVLALGGRQQLEGEALVALHAREEEDSSCLLPAHFTRTPPASLVLHCTFSLLRTLRTFCAFARTAAALPLHTQREHLCLYVAKFTALRRTALASERAYWRAAY